MTARATIPTIESVNELPPVATFRRVGKFLHLGREHIARMVEQGRLHAIKLPDYRGPMIHRESVRDYLEGKTTTKAQTFREACDEIRAGWAKKGAA